MPIYGVRHKGSDYFPVNMGEFSSAEAARADFDKYSDSTDHEFIDITEMVGASMEEHGKYPPPGAYIPGRFSASPEVTEAAEEAAEVAEEAAEAIAEAAPEIVEEVVEVAEVAAEAQVEAIVEVAEEAAAVAEVEATLAEKAEKRDDGAAEAEHAAAAETAAEAVVETAVTVVPEDDLPPKVTHWWYKERGARAG